MGNPDVGARRPRLWKYTLCMALLLLALQAGFTAAGVRYWYVNTDVLASGEANFLSIVRSVISPLTVFLRYAFLLWGCFNYGQKRSGGLLAVTLGSLVLSGAGDVFLASYTDASFSANIRYHLLSAGLSLIVGICASMFLWAAAAERTKKFKRGKAKKKNPLNGIYLAAALTTYAIDALYLTYTVFEMALSETGLAFDGASDILLLVHDYVYPLGEAAFGFAVMFACGAVFNHIKNKSGEHNPTGLPEDDKHAETAIK